MPTARPASKPSTKSSGHRGTLHAGSTQCKRHVCDDLSSVRLMTTQTASCSPAPRPAPQKNCIRTLQTPHESILQQNTRRGTLKRRLRPGQRRLGVASEIRARSRGVRWRGMASGTLPGNVAQVTVPTTNRITSLARFEKSAGRQIEIQARLQGCSWQDGQN